MKRITIGRQFDNDVLINNNNVSSHHAVLIVTDMLDVSIQDLNSTNGTFVNGTRISEPTLLHPSDEVYLSNVPLDWRECIARNQEPKDIEQKVILPSDLTEKKSIGKNQKCDIQYSQAGISNCHAYLCKNAARQILIFDNQSTNGTFVNGQKVANAVLKKGDTVMLAGNLLLDWEKIINMEPIKKPQSSNLWKYLVGAVVALVAIIIAFCIPWKSKLTPEEIFSRYKSSVVLIYCTYHYDVLVQGRPLGDYLEPLTNDAHALDICHLSPEGNVEAGSTGFSGTAFFISEDGKLMTNRHCTQAGSANEAEEIKKQIGAMLCRFAEETTNTSKRNKIYSLAANIDVQVRLDFYGYACNDTYVNSLSDFTPCVVLKQSEKEELDIAILQANNKKTPADKQIVDINDYSDEKSMAIGKSIYTLGFPQSFMIGSTKIGLEANNQNGTITQERGAYEYANNLAITSGASGSPIFDEYGKFAGVVYATFTQKHGYSLSIRPAPASELAK